jgi:glycerol-3-phosphate O-acyltransferase
VVDGAIVDDPARDAEYTSGLASRILEAYRADTVALPGAIVAFALFELLRRKSPQLDLYRLLRSAGPETSVPATAVAEEAAALLAELRQLAGAGRIRLSVEATDPSAVLHRGLETFRAYHAEPVIERAGGLLWVRDANLAFFYRNRLEGYGLRGAAPLVGAGA